MFSRFLVDGEVVTSCTNNLVGKHFDFFYRCTLDPNNTKSVFSGLISLVISNKTRPEISGKFCDSHSIFQTRPCTTPLELKNPYYRYYYQYVPYFLVEVTLEAV